jgi:hypothetical protein
MKVSMAVIRSLTERNVPGGVLQGANAKADALNLAKFR